MSSISTALPQQLYFQAATQPLSKADATKTAAPAVVTASAAPQVTEGLAKPIESLKTKNSDGTYGPKHTRFPPGVYNKQQSNGPSTESPESDSVSTVNVKV